MEGKRTVSIAVPSRSGAYKWFFFSCLGFSNVSPRLANVYD
jgi:hypothetical protein